MDDLKIKYQRYIRNNVFKQLMIDNNITTYKKLAELANIPDAKMQMLSQLSSMRIKDPNHYIVKKVARFFKVTPEYLLSESMTKAATHFYSKNNKIIKDIDSKQFIQLQESKQQLLIGELNG